MQMFAACLLNSHRFRSCKGGISIRLLMGSSVVSVAEISMQHQMTAGKLTCILFSDTDSGTSRMDAGTISVTEERTGNGRRGTRRGTPSSSSSSPTTTAGGPTRRSVTESRRRPWTASSRGRSRCLKPRMSKLPASCRKRPDSSGTCVRNIDTGHTARNSG